MKELRDRNGNVVDIIRDECPNDPRGYENIGTMALHHRLYNLGDKHGLSTDEIQGLLNLKTTVSLAVYAYEHGELTISTRPFSCPWDSGQLGVIFVTKAKVIETFGGWNAENKAKALECLEQEVKTYDDYLTGEVYGFRTLDSFSGEEIDSCYGFYGSDHEKSGLLESARVELATV
jgi:hypothetical protein